ncbi:MAG: hypothetical protein AAF417_21155 [Pseudomonadota bacterium]
MAPKTLLMVFLLTVHELGVAQEITPEPPTIPPDRFDDITVELLYLGVSKPLTSKVIAQGYAAYGYDDDLALAIADLGRSIGKGVQLGGRYVYFGSSGNRDQHSFWGYLNAEARPTVPSRFGLCAETWRFERSPMTFNRPWPRWPWTTATGETWSWS